MRHKISNQSSVLELSGIESISSLVFLFEQKDFSPRRKLLIASHNDLEKIKSFLNFKKGKKSWYDLPPFPKPKSIYSETILLKRRKWQTWAQYGETSALFLASPQALLKKTNLSSCGLIIEKGKSFSFSSLNHYQEKALVEKAGDFSSRDFLIDIFSPAYETPLRLQLMGESIESIFLLDADFKRRKKELEKAFIPSLYEWSFKGEDRKTLCAHLKKQELDLHHTLPPEIFQSFSRGKVEFGFENLLNCLDTSCSLDCFPSPPLVCLFEPEKTKSIFLEEKSKLESEHPFFIQENLFLAWNKLEEIGQKNSSSKESLDKEMSLIKVRASFPKSLSSNSLQNDSSLKNFSSTLFKKTTHLKEDLKKLPVQHIVFAGPHIEEIKKELSQLGSQDFFEEKNLIFLESPIKESFYCKGDTAYLKTEDFQKKQKLNHFDFFRKRAKALEFSRLEVGDLLVHKQHGVGEFVGLKSLKLLNKKEDFIVLKYKEGDKLFVPAYRASQVKRYSRKRIDSITKNLLDRLGNPRLWERKKTQAKKHIQSLAIELIELYRLRKQKKRKPFAPVKEALNSFVKDFPFVETPDQKRVFQEIMVDMDKEQSMDRLLTADTGFGKTEIALRACFRALESNFQVCFLAPTTVLTLQHFENFKQRFKNTPFRLELLNRFVSKKQKDLIFQKTKKGELDFLVATHSVFSPQLSFKNLGLLVLDEEHRFGVRQKERLFRFRKNLDILSLSATPIPRTLNMALTGIKDVSVINKPPESRKRVKIIMKAWNEGAQELIIQAGLKEKARNGQILFVHNRVKTLYQRAEQIQNWLPELKVAVAHGQMKNLEKIMLDFFDKKYDLLVSTNIIESGMDIPQANTLFIDRVHEMGLSQIYQLKGRVGRAKDQAYCYLLFPERDRLSPLAQERLGLLEKYAGFGEGFQLALYDLENRGAGSLFGSKQSGHLQSLGEDLYFEILNEQLKNEKSIFIEPEIRLPFSTNIPNAYIPDSRLRLLYYKNLSETLVEEDRLAIQSELLEEFGAFPEELKNLFFLLEIRDFCKKTLITDFRATKQTVSLTFHEKTLVPSQAILKVLEASQGQMLSNQTCKIPFKTNDFFEEIKQIQQNLRQSFLFPS